MKQILPILADIANGIFATVLAGFVVQTDIVWEHFLIGIPLAMLPDLDAVPELLRRGKVAASKEYIRDHREGLHYPLAFLLIGVGLIWLNPFFGWLFLIATMLHFLNDFWGVGWGIVLLWPFSANRYKLLERRANHLKQMLIADGDWEKLPEDERKVHLVVSWTKNELPRYIARWGLEDWIDRYYLTLNWTAGVEYTLFAFSIFILIVTLIH